MIDKALTSALSEPIGRAEIEALDSSIEAPNASIEAIPPE
jgi:hypothetical protein